MKLIYCKSCQDVYKVDRDLRSCRCGKTAAIHIDRENMIYGGEDAVVLGIDNNTLRTVYLNQRLDGFAPRIDAYACCTWTESAIKVDGLEEMSEEEIFQFLARHYPRKEWVEAVYQKRSGVSGILYRICRSLMEIQIKKIGKIKLSPQAEQWYSDYTERILKQAKRLMWITDPDQKMFWFDTLRYFCFRDYSLLQTCEKLDIEDLYELIREKYNSEYKKREAEEEKETYG